MALTSTAPSRTAITDQARARELPLFLVPEGPAGYGYIRSLAERMACTLPVALQWPEHGDRLTTIEAMASGLVERIRAIQPNGPYRLAGRSCGAVLAYAIAHHLLGEDEPVSFLGLVEIDAALEPEPPNRRAEQATMLDESIAAYEMPPLPLVAHVFRRHSRSAVPKDGTEPRRNAVARCEHALARSSVRVVPIRSEGDEPSDFGENAHAVSDRLAETLRDEQAASFSARPSHEPLMLLHASKARGIPIVCVPGAGASITSFIDLIHAYGDRSSIFGLQPRGIDGMDIPHGSVEAAARCNLKSIEHLTSAGPVHLLGHSYGGAVAFEMASRLAERGGSVATLTMIDSSLPNGGRGEIRDVTNEEIVRGFVEALELSFEEKLSIDEQLLSAGSFDPLVRQLHDAMLAKGLVPASSEARMLKGPLTAFAAANRCRYTPRSPYTGKVLLILARDPSLDPAEDAQERARISSEWRTYARNLVDRLGPGNHFSILRPPHVERLIDMWSEALGSAA